MISFEHFQPQDGTPIYQQIILHIKRGIVSGSVMTGDALPSRRVLSTLLGVNPNTIQKAYHLLEEEHLITSHTGAKSYIVIDDETVAHIRRQLMETELRGTVRALKQMGLSKEEATAIISALWEESPSSQT